MTKFKRIIICLLVAIMVCTCFSGITIKDEKLTLAIKMTRAFWEQENGEGSAKNLEAYNIKGLDGEEDYILVSNIGPGYAIYSRDNMELIEYSANATSPYSSVGHLHEYYGGPLNYYKISGNKLINILTKETFEKNELSSIATAMNLKLEQIKQQRESEKSVVSEKVELADLGTKGNETTAIPPDNSQISSEYFDIVSQKLVYKSNYFLRNPYVYNNNDGTCSTIAAQLLLSYNHFIHDSRIINNSEYLDINQEQPYASVLTNVNFYAKLLELIDPNAYVAYSNNTVRPKSERGRSIQYIKNGIDMYILTENNTIANKVTYGFMQFSNATQTKNYIESQIDLNRPLIVSVDFYQKNSNSVSGYDIDNHAVVVYGYQTFKINGENVDGFIGHYGMNGLPNSENIWFNTNWLNNKCFYFYPTHNHLNPNPNASNFTPYMSNVTEGHILQCSICNGYATTNNHIYSGNYEQNTKFMYDFNENSIIVRDYVYHKAMCICGDYRLQLHDYNYTYHDVGTHKKECTNCREQWFKYNKNTDVYEPCSYEDHYIKREGVCLYCGQL